MPKPVEGEPVGIAFYACEEAAERASQHDHHDRTDTFQVGDRFDLIVTGIDGIICVYHHDQPMCMIKELRGDFRVIECYPAMRVGIIDVPDDARELD